MMHQYLSWSCCKVTIKYSMVSLTEYLKCRMYTMYSTVLESSSKFHEVRIPYSYNEQYSFKVYLRMRVSTANDCNGCLNVGIFRVSVLYVQTVLYLSVPFKNIVHLLQYCTQYITVQYIESRAYCGCDHPKVCTVQYSTILERMILKEKGRGRDDLL